MDLQSIANEARRYCETEQQREFILDGACHENVIGAGDYVRFNTDYTPVIVWGVVTHRDSDDVADSISEVSEVETHFWLELKEDKSNNIIDVYTNNPLLGDVSECIESGIAYGGPLPKCYKPVEKFEYFGKIDSYTLCNKDNFVSFR